MTGGFCPCDAYEPARPGVAVVDDEMCVCGHLRDAHVAAFPEPCGADAATPDYLDHLKEQAA